MLTCILYGASVLAADEIHWTITGPTSVSFDWRGTASEGSIAYGTSAGSYSTTISAVHPTGTCVPWSSAGPFWEARLTGLSADTLYHYSIAFGPDHTFRTPPPVAPASFDVLVEGDIGDSAHYAGVAGVQQQMSQELGARFALLVGDLTYGDGNTQSAVDGHFNDVMPWSRDVAYMPAWGNHEWEHPGDDLRNYKGRFDFPNPQTSPASPAISDCGEDWYWYDYGGVRFIAYPEPWKDGVEDALIDWNTKATVLMNAAEADPNIRFIVTFGHRPAYSSGHHAGYEKLKGFMDELAASHSKYVLNVNGHSHNYERSFPQNGNGDNAHGAVHVTVGTGGSSLETDGPCLWLTCQQPVWSAVRYFHLGYLKLAFSSSSIQGSFVCGPSGAGTNDIACTPGSVIDSFTILPGVPAAALYVDQANAQCSANGAGSASQPFCTIAQGVTRAVAGNTVIVKSGTYPEGVTLTKSGTSTQPIVIKAEPGANVVVSGQFRGFEISSKSWITIQGFTISDTSSYGIYVTNSSNITIAGNHVSRAGQPVSGSTRQGIRFSGTTNSVISGNTTDYNSDAGIVLTSGTTGVAVTGNVSHHNARGYTRAAPGIDVRSGGNTLQGNICHDNEDSGIQIYGTGLPPIPAPNNLVVNNLCYNNGDHGIDVSSAGSQRIIGNTVYDNTTAGINVEGPSSGSTLRNNISVDNAIASLNTKGNIYVDAASVPGTTIDYDLVALSAPATMISWGGVNYGSLATFVAATGQEAHGLQADPRWIGPSVGDFHLLPVSPAIDSADSGASGALSADLDGRSRVDVPTVPNTGVGPRAFDDRGAYEHPICGNGIKEPGEECDGADTGIALCGTQGCLGGDPSCTPQCTLNYATCTGCAVCGNGVKEFGESCDGGDLAGASCEGMGQCSIGGGLSCTPDCRFNTAGCSCGDNVVQGSCGEVCDAANLAGQSCVSQGFPAGGNLSCQINCAAFDTASCNVCGDGVRQPTEPCDGTDLGGASCVSQGCFAGAPTCSGTCALNYASCSNCWGGVLHVDKASPACSDASQGSAAVPFCTINGAAARVVAGGTVIVASGTYPEHVKVLTSGTPTAPIVFKAAPGATVQVTGQLRGLELSNKSWVTMEGFIVSATKEYGVYVTGCSNVTIRNNWVSHAGTSGDSGTTKPGIYISGTSDALISGNTTEDNSDSGIYVASNSSNLVISGNVSARNARGYTRAASGIELRSGGNTVRGNICHDNEESGIAIKPFVPGVPAPNNVIVNNVTYGNGFHGIGINASASQRIVGNTVYANLESGIDLSGASGMSLIANNVVVDNASNLVGITGGNLRVDSASVTGTTLDYDLVFRSQPGSMISWNGVVYSSLATFVAATGQEAHGLQSDPLWVSPGTADFRPRIGSPAIDSANSGTSGAISTDLAGTIRTDDPATANTGAGPRPYDDRGAYEYPLDADNDGYASDEDCDDMNAAINPGAFDQGCDGIDNDCNPATPDVRDADGDTVTCAVDCDDSDASVYPGAPEINDGKDNQCPGGSGYRLIDETSGDSGFHTPGVKSNYSWPAQSGATSYDVARANARDFSVGCQTTRTTGPQWVDAAIPSAGQSFFYLNRPATPFTGSWGARSSGVVRTGICP